jgi:hypothetical protein
MTERPVKNPFRPGVGTPPRFLAGRDDAINRFHALLRAAPELPANMRVTGLRGVGKTVLLNTFSDLALQDNWFPSSVELQPGHNGEEALLELITKLLADARRRISTTERIRAAIGGAVRAAGGLGITWNDITVSYEPASSHDNDIAKDLFDTTELAVDKGYSGFILLLDEAQVVKDDTRSSGEHPLSMLIACVSTLQRSGVPIGLVMCGLPTLTSNLLRARSYTERMFRGEVIASLVGDPAIKAFTEPLKGTGISLEAGLAQEVINEVEGYPYFIQLWGAELWDAAVNAGTTKLTRRLLSAIREDIYRRLDLDFYAPRIETLTPAEQDLLLSTVNCEYPPLVVAQLKEASDKTPQNINVLLGRLVESGVMYRLRQGQYEYTAPKFREYLERHPR